MCPFFPGNCTKITKKKKPNQKNPNKPKDSQVIVIACLQHTEQFAPSSLYEAFFHSRQHRKHTLSFFFFNCMAVLN